MNAKQSNGFAPLTELMGFISDITGVDFGPADGVQWTMPVHCDRRPSCDSLTPGVLQST